MLLLVLCSLFSFAAISNVDHEGICSQTTKVCATYHTDLPFSVGQEGRFALYLQSNDSIEATLVKADLWMQMGTHGHGSSPLKITPTAPGEYDITKAFFVMKGAWQIRVTYKQGDVQETLIIPLVIK